MDSGPQTVGKKLITIFHLVGCRVRHMLGDRLKHCGALRQKHEKHEKEVRASANQQQNLQKRKHRSSTDVLEKIKESPCTRLANRADCSYKEKTG
jgi:hypothetical protein